MAYYYRSKGKIVVARVRRHLSDKDLAKLISYENKFEVAEEQVYGEAIEEMEAMDRDGDIIYGEFDTEEQKQEVRDDVCEYIRGDLQAIYMYQHTGPFKFIKWKERKMDKLAEHIHECIACQIRYEAKGGKQILVEYRPRKKEEIKSV